MNNVTTKAPRLTEAQKRAVECPTCGACAGKACRGSRIPGANTFGGGWGGPPDLERAHNARRTAALLLPSLPSDSDARRRAEARHASPNPSKPKKTKATTVIVRETGEVLTLAPRVPTGDIPCPGEAHTNAYIDHCGLCAPRWGVIMGYAEPTVEDCLNGFAVPCGLISDREKRAPFEAAEKAGTIKLVAVETKNSSFYVYTTTACTTHTDCKGTHALGKACREETDRSWPRVCSRCNHANNRPEEAKQSAAGFFCTWCGENGPLAAKAVAS